MEQDKRIRREIANSNERRRMQSINAGFQSLRNLLPQQEGEKLSKAAILQQTADFIFQLQHEKSKLVSQNSQLKRLVASNGEGAGSAVYSTPHSPAAEMPPTLVKRRKTIDGAVESADEGIGNMSPDHSGSGSGGEDSRSELNELRRETVDLKIQLERERRHRARLEEQIGSFQQQHHPTAYPMKFENERIVEVQTVDEFESFQRVPTPGRGMHDEAPRCYTVRNNLETIVEAIRHLEGDHLFSDDRNNSTPSSTPPSSGSPRAMEVCSSAGSSPSHSHGQTIVEIAPLALNSGHGIISHTLVGQQIQVGGSGVAFSSSSTSGTSTTVTSLKHHVLNRLARSSEAEEPINLEFRPVSPRSPSPMQQQSMQFPVNQQPHRPGVIVVKPS